MCTRSYDFKRAAPGGLLQKSLSDIQPDSQRCQTRDIRVGMINALVTAKSPCAFVRGFDWVYGFERVAIIFMEFVVIIVFMSAATQ